MNIAFVVNLFPNFTETFVRNLQRGLEQRGHTVTIFATMNHTASNTQGPNPAGDHVNGCTIRRQNIPADKSHRVVKALRIVQHNFQGDRRHMLRHLNFLRHGRKAWSLRLLYEGALFSPPQRFDVIHCQFGNLADLALRQRELGGIMGPVLVHFRGYDITKHLRDAGTGAYDRAFRDADYFVANCRVFRDKAIALGCPAEKIEILPSGTDLDMFPIIERKPPRDRPIRIVSVARLVEKKGIEYGIRAIAELRARNIPVTYEIIGQGPLMGRMQAIIRDCGLTNQVALMGQRNTAGVVGALHAADIFLAPLVQAANGDLDGPVNTAKEAMATGLPVIASDLDTMKELIDDGITGQLVAQSSPTAIADALQRLSRQPELWADIGRAGRARIVRDFDNEMTNDRLIQIYRRVVAAQSETENAAFG